MTAPHTPGPWKAEGWKGTVVNDGNGRTLVLCPGATADEASANARLIASAPSLLEALEKVRDYRESLRDPRMGEGQRRMIEEWIEGIIESAISAARGE